jgi:Ran GTPase-activating protein (RanGAP) involved in mRNA processing and transport
VTSTSKPRTFQPLVALGIVLVVGVVAVISILGLFFVGDADTDDANIAIAIQDYLRAFSDDDVTEACELETESFRDSRDADCETAYEEILASIDDLEYEDVEVSDIEDDDETGSASVSYTRVIEDEELDCQDLAYSLIEDEGDWLIDSRDECATEAASE